MDKDIPQLLTVFTPAFPEVKGFTVMSILCRQMCDLHIFTSSVSCKILLHCADTDRRVQSSKAEQTREKNSEKSGDIQRQSKKFTKGRFTQMKKKKTAYFLIYLKLHRAMQIASCIWPGLEISISEMSASIPHTKEVH